ncbi:glycolipid transport [Seminavis robusta]|uniref:Glycolipid transport n=1 Tax=Seminavis robusta TaxID=568900 RepID=A0A9N8E7A8_9STRA|nr:glycolipid transport [Seminavis robusta]|eukprot:Sro758_g198100.1 glycolipid transport (666) ;mRNA; r:32170-34819
MMMHYNNKKNEAQLMRRVTSMDALVRGRSRLPRPRSNDDISSAGSKFSRASSLGRHRAKRASLKDGATNDPLASQPSCRPRVRRERATSAEVVSGHGQSESRTWVVGRLSMMLLLFVTFSDLALTVVNNQMNTIESHDDYDALSPDVIRPAFLYKTSVPSLEKPTIGLGSAAISSITDALGPILPFTGGVDLRRSEYYDSGNFFESVSALVQQTFEAYANAKEASTPTDAVVDETVTAKKTKMNSKSKKDKKKHASTLGGSQSFVPLKDIAELTLEDVVSVFEYAIGSTQQGFNQGKFASKLLPRVKTVIEGMDSAVTKARGKNVKVVKRHPSDSAQSGEMDAFMFCASSRIFAEWRILRQVPEGFKGYAVGMSLGQKDVVQNVVKIERAAQAWIEDHIEDAGSEVSSPTLRDVLEYEIVLGEHPNLPRLKETSGAMGLLWVRRQLQYQTAIFQNILEVPTRFPTSTDAVTAAYTQIYGNLHGWAVQKIFNYSFQASPNAEEVYKFMNPHRLKEVFLEARRMKPAVNDAPDNGEEGDTVEKPESLNPPDNPFHRIGWEWDRFMNHISQQPESLNPPDNPFHRIGWEWEKFVAHIVQHLDGRKGENKGYAHTGEGLVGEELEEYVVAEMSKDVHEHIVSYLSVAGPLLADLAELHDDLNMDDPTKV